MVWFAKSVKGLSILMSSKKAQSTAAKAAKLHGTAHSSRDTKKIADNFVHNLQWPEDSPAINPVENVRTMLESFVKKKKTNKQTGTH